jgi:hypothetical protein
VLLFQNGALAATLVIYAQDLGADLPVSCFTRGRKLAIYYDAAAAINRSTPVQRRTTWWKNCCRVFREEVYRVHIVVLESYRPSVDLLSAHLDGFCSILSTIGYVGNTWNSGCNSYKSTLSDIGLYQS